MDAPQQRRRLKPKSRMRKADRKRQLLQHAKQLFITLGYLHTTTEKIAQAADVTEPVLYRHFASKKDLFIEVLDDIRRSTIHRWHVTTAIIEDPLKRLHSIVDLYLGSTSTHALEFRLMHSSLVEADDPDIISCLRRFYLDSEKMLCEVIREGQKTGVFRADLEPPIAAWELIRNALAYTLTLPLALPVYQQKDYIPKAIECMLSCLRA